MAEIEFTVGDVTAKVRPSLALIAKAQEAAGNLPALFFAASKGEPDLIAMAKGIAVLMRESGAEADEMSIYAELCNGSPALSEAFAACVMPTKAGAQKKPRARKAV